MNEAFLTEGVIGRRVVGWLIDAVILAVLMGILYVLVLLLGVLTLGLGWYLFGGLWLVPSAYSFVWIASLSQATPGQIMMGLRVVRDDDLGRPSPAQALVYAAGFWITMAAGVVLILVALLTNRSRCLHDIVSGLTVVRSAALTAGQTTWTMAGGPFDR